MNQKTWQISSLKFPTEFIIQMGLSRKEWEQGFLQKEQNADGFNIRA
jgi:hypothetical protein